MSQAVASGTDAIQQVQSKLPYFSSFQRD